MKKIGIADFCNYHFLSSLCANKSALYFIDTIAKEDKSDYKQRLLRYDLKTNALSTIKDYEDRIPVLYVDEDKLFVRKIDKEEKKVKTDVLVLDGASGDKKDEFILPIDVSEIKSYDDNYYLVSATIKVKDPDYYL